MQLTGLGNHMPLGIRVLLWVMFAALPPNGFGLADHYVDRQ